MPSLSVTPQSRSNVTTRQPGVRSQGSYESRVTSAARSGRSAQQQPAWPQRRTTTPRSTRHPHSAHSTRTSSVLQAITRVGTACRRHALGGRRVQSGRRASSRWPRPTSLADASGSIVAVVRDEAAKRAASETAHASPSNGPVHDQTSLDVRRSDLAGCFPRTGREHHPVGAKRVARVQCAARCHRPYAK